MVISESWSPARASPGLLKWWRATSFALDHAALLIGAWDYPKRDLEQYRALLDDIAKRVAPDVERAVGGPQRAARDQRLAVRAPRLTPATPTTTTIRATASCAT